MRGQALGCCDVHTFCFDMLQSSGCKPFYRETLTSQAVTHSGAQTNMTMCALLLLSLPSEACHHLTVWSSHPTYDLPLQCQVTQRHGMETGNLRAQRPAMYALRKSLMNLHAARACAQTATLKAGGARTVTPPAFKQLGWPWQQAVQLHCPLSLLQSPSTRE